MKKIRAKIVSIMLICTIVSIVLVGALSISTANKIVDENSVQRLNLLCSASQQKLNSVIDGIEQSVNILAEYTQTSLSDYDKFKADSNYVKSYSEDLSDMLMTLAENTIGSVAVYVRFNPEFTEPSSGLFFVKDEATDKFISNAPTDISMYDRNDVEHVGWYYIPVSSGEATWMPPYENQNIDTYMISYVAPIYKNGECYGIVGMDIDFNLIQEIVNDISIYNTGYAFLVNKDEEVMYHPTLAVYTNLSDILGINLTEINENDYSEANITQYNYGGIEKSMSIAKLDNDMYIVLSAPVKEIFKDSETLTKQIVIIAFIAVAIVTVLGALLIGKIIKITTIDPLTGIFNRPAFISNVKKRLLKGNGEGYAFIMIDIDHFKLINDSQGHTAGDAAIKQVALNMCRVLQKDDIIGRYGGDEFLIFMECQNKDIVIKRMEQLQELLNYGGGLYHDKISCSIGIVYTDNYLVNVDSLMIAADAAMYKAKANGRSRYEFSEELI